MKTSSAKAKGRNLQNAVRDLIVAILPDRLKCQARAALMGETGADIKIVGEARDYFPYSVECKNQERLNLWASWDQTTHNAGKEKLSPLLFIKKNRTEILAVMKATEFFDMLNQIEVKNVSNTSSHS